MLNDLDLLMIDNASDAGRDVRRGRAQRRDGWTPERIRIFLQVLARSGIVAEAARAAGISAKSAYALRNSAKGTAFARAWTIAQSAERRPAARFGSRVYDGVIVPIMRRGKVWGQHRRPDNPHIMRVLRNLDRTTRQAADEEVLRAAEDFDACVARAAESAPSFPARARQMLPLQRWNERHWRPSTSLPLQTNPRFQPSGAHAASSHAFASPSTNEPTTSSTRE